MARCARAIGRLGWRLGMVAETVAPDTRFVLESVSETIATMQKREKEITDDITSLGKKMKVGKICACSVVPSAMQRGRSRR